MWLVTNVEHLFFLLANNSSLHSTCRDRLVKLIYQNQFEMYYISLPSLTFKIKIVTSLIKVNSIEQCFK